MVDFLFNVLDIAVHLAQALQVYGLTGKLHGGLNWRSQPFASTTDAVIHTGLRTDSIVVSHSDVASKSDLATHHIVLADLG